MQARIQSYEQGEIERNVALQSIAKRLKEENDQLRQENTALQARIAQITADAEARATETPQTADKKRWRDESPQSTTSLPTSARKKPKKAVDPEEGTMTSLHSSRLPSPSSMVSTPDSASTNCTPYISHPYGTPPDDYDNFQSLSSVSKHTNDILSSFVPFGCGFCDGGNICVCQEIAGHEGDRSLDFKDDFGGSDLMQISQANVHDKAKENPQLSILDNLPAYQPALPLRRRTTGVTQINSIFPVTPLSERATNATCSGDPSNCLACGDDAFGKAFCDAIGNTTATKKRCDNCPGGSQCQDNRSHPSGDTPSSSDPGRTADLMPTNDAWRQLKAHPNVQFADLSLLAEVVASRSKCSGPRIAISPPDTQDSAPPSINPRNPQSHQDRNNSPPRLVPQEVLLECGRRSLRHVHADGVREALRLLDAKFS